MTTYPNIGTSWFQGNRDQMDSHMCMNPVCFCICTDTSEIHTLCIHHNLKWAQPMYINHTLVRCVYIFCIDAAWSFIFMNKEHSRKLRWLWQRHRKKRVVSGVMISVKSVSECLYTYVQQNEEWCTLCSVESSKMQEGICVGMHGQFTLKDLEANNATLL